MKLDDLVSVHAVAASNASGVQKFVRYPGVTTYGRENTMLCVGGKCKTFDSGVVEKVPVTTMDAFLDAQGINSAFFVSVDTEGSDALVIEGMARSLTAKRVRIIEFEYGAKGYWAAAKDVGKADAARQRGVKEHDRRTLERLLRGVLAPSAFTCYWQAKRHLVPALDPCWENALIGQSASHSNLICAHDREVLDVFESRTLRASSAHVLVDVHCEGRSHRIWPGTNKSVKAICDEYYGSAARACACTA